MKSFSVFRTVLPLALVLLMGILSSSCGDEAPVKELTAARTELAFAEEEMNDERSQEPVEKAKATLVEAHQALAEGDYELAKSKADESFNLARQARLYSTPSYAASMKTTAEDSLQSAVDAGLSAESRENYQTQLDAGNTEYQSAEEIRGSGGESGESLAADKQTEMLNSYRSSYLVFQDVDAKGKQERRNLVTLRYEMERRLNDIERRLDQAQGYGADQEDPENFSAARKAIADARSAIDGKNDGVATERTDEAERLTELLYETAVRKRSEDLAEQARIALQETRAKRTSTFPEQPSDETNLEIYNRSAEYLVAADEAMASSDRNRKDKKYGYAADDAREVLQLTSIIKEQLLGVRGEKASDRSAAVASDQSSSGAGMGKDWKEYTVKKAVPVETLWGIAKKPSIYGKGSLWKKIYRANEEMIRNPDRIYPGWKLKIPPKNEGK